MTQRTPIIQPHVLAEIRTRRERHHRAIQRLRDCPQRGLRLRAFKAGNASKE